MDLYRTFAEGQHLSRRHLAHRTGALMTPHGRIHAAEHSAIVTLCGRPTSELFEFGRRSYPFELEPAESRCRTCDGLAGHPAELSRALG